MTAAGSASRADEEFDTAGWVPAPAAHTPRAGRESRATATRSLRMIPAISTSGMEVPCPRIPGSDTRTILPTGLFIAGGIRQPRGQRLVDDHDAARPSRSRPVMPRPASTGIPSVLK